MASAGGEAIFRNGLSFVRQATIAAIGRSGAITLGQKVGARTKMGRAGSLAETKPPQAAIVSDAVAMAEARAESGVAFDDFVPAGLGKVVHGARAAAPAGFRR